jgi:hypothetical protein
LSLSRVAGLSGMGGLLGMELGGSYIAAIGIGSRPFIAPATAMPDRRP